MWATRTLPRFRLFAYAFLLLAGIGFTLYQTPLLRERSVGVQIAFHIVLCLASLIAIGGVLAHRERVEQAGLVVILGPLLVYAFILSLAAWNQPPPGRWATAALACLVLALVGLVMVPILDIRREIKRAAEARRKAAERGQTWGP